MAIPLAGLGSYGVQLSSEMSHWDQTPGVVTGASISEQASAQIGQKEYTGFYYWEYTVDGTPQHGSFQSGGAGLRYQQGQGVDVFYDPDDPSRSALWRESNLSTYMGFGLASFMVLLDSGFFWLSGSVHSRAQPALEASDA